MTKKIGSGRGRRWVQQCMGVSLAAWCWAMPALASPISTVFLVCEGVFTMESDWLPDAPPESFDGSIYVSVTRNDDSFSQIKLQPFERSERLRSQTFEPTGPLIDAGAKGAGNMPPAGELKLEESYVVTISATNDEVILHERRESGALVKARIDDQPLVPTRMNVTTVDMALNRFLGRMKLKWGERKVHDVRPTGAIRATKVTYLESKIFDATCHTMQERLF